MARFVAMGQVYFDGAADSDAWAQAQVEWIKNNTQVLAAQSALVAPGAAEERTSWMGAFEVDDDTGALTLISAWHLGADNVVREELPVADDPEPPPPAGAPLWVEGASYTVGNEVTDPLDDQVYRCISAHTAWAGTNWYPSTTPSLWVQA